MVSGRKEAYNFQEAHIIYRYIYIYISKGSSQPRFQTQAVCFIYMCVCVCVCVAWTVVYSPWGHKESDTTKRLNTLAMCVCVCKT